MRVFLWVGIYVWMASYAIKINWKIHLSFDHSNNQRLLFITLSKSVSSLRDWTLPFLKSYCMYMNHLIVYCSLEMPNRWLSWFDEGIADALSLICQKQNLFSFFFFNCTCSRGGVVDISLCSYSSRVFRRCPQANWVGYQETDPLVNFRCQYSVHVLIFSSFTAYANRKLLKEVVG